MSKVSVEKLSKLPTTELWQLPDELLFYLVSFVAAPTHRANVLCHQLAPLSNSDEILKKIAASSRDTVKKLRFAAFLLHAVACGELASVFVAAPSIASGTLTY
jgi:hypothetical protein